MAYKCCNMKRGGHLAEPSILAVTETTVEAAAKERIATLVKMIKTVTEKMRMAAERFVAFLEVTENDRKLIPPHFVWPDYLMAIWQPQGMGLIPISF